MILFILFLCASVSSITGAEEDCNTPISEVCHYSIIAKGVLKTEEDLKRQCKDGKQVLNCAVSRETECNPDSDQLKKYQELLETVNELCEEYTPIYQAIAVHIECLSSAYEKSVVQCPSIEIVTRNIDKVIKKAGLISKLNEQPSCRTALEGFGCVLLGMHHDCGGVQLNALVEVLMRFNLPVQCSPDISAQLEEFYQEVISDVGIEVTSDVGIEVTSDVGIEVTSDVGKEVTSDDGNLE